MIVPHWNLRGRFLEYIELTLGTEDMFTDYDNQTPSFLQESTINSRIVDEIICYAEEFVHPNLQYPRSGHL